MRFAHRDGTIVHLGYGTNVLPAMDVDGLIAQSTGLGDRIRQRLGTDRIGLGMWLPAVAAHQLAGDVDELHRMRDALAEHHVEIVTLNAFPYADFQGQKVKKDVYLPTWSERARLEYTLAAATTLAGLLPEDAAYGSISSLPFAWHEPWTGERQAQAERNLELLARGLDRIEETTGRRIVVAIEPEPGCVVETIAEAVERLSRVDRDRIGICLDLCHLAVGFEDADAAVAELARAGLKVYKSQPGTALLVDDPADGPTRTALAGYAEDRFLHQVRQSRDGESVHARDDLPQALDGATPLDPTSAWRVHFHVPVHADPQAPLRNSRAELRDSLAALLGGERAQTAHLEVETYTWSVLPGGAPANNGELAAGLAAELAFVRDELLGLGLSAM